MPRVNPSVPLLAVLTRMRLCYHKAVSLENAIRTHAARLGFTLCGFTRLSVLPRASFFSDWLAQGFAGEMHYLAREPQRRIDPHIPFPQARSVICLGFPYSPPVLPQIELATRTAGSHGRLCGWSGLSRCHHKKAETVRCFSQRPTAGDMGSAVCGHRPLAGARLGVSQRPGLVRQKHHAAA